MSKIVKPRAKRKKKSKPLGTAVVLGGLLFAGWLCLHTGSQRSTQMVWDNLETIQGRYAGQYFKAGRRTLIVVKPTGERVELLVDGALRLRSLPREGWPVEISAIKEDGRYKLVRGEDLKRVREADRDEQGGLL